MAGKVGVRACLIDIESTSLDADIGQLVGVGIMELDGKFKWFYVKKPDDEKKILKRIVDLLGDYHVIFSWSGKGFDIPFLTARALKHRLRAENLYKPIHVDLAEFVKNHLRLCRSDLYHVARFLGIRKDLRVEGFDIPSLYQRAIKGDKRAESAIRKHCEDDLRTTLKILKKILPILKAKSPELVL